jgi:two-component system CheB/CheR fusion protein
MMALTAPQREQNISDYKREDRLHETLERYELVFKATNDVLYELDLMTGNVVWNEALHAHYGYSRKEPSGTLEWWAAHIHPDDALKVEQELAEWFDDIKDSWESQYRFQKADGSYVEILDRGIVQRSQDGVPLRMIGTMLDVTKQKQLDRAKDEFISLVSHQLRTPLTAIRIYSEMLTSGLFGELTEQQKKHAQQITDSSLRLIKLVGDIMNISQIEMGYIVSNPILTNINSMLATAIDDVLPMANERNVSILFQPDKKLKSVAVDPTIIGQVVHNLLTNAIRYSKPKKGKVEVVFQRTKTGYLISVEDNGIGIPKSARPYVFNRFYRADNTVNIEEQGTGLGLYLVKQMVESSGCKVWFESTLGKGTTFYIEIPLTGMITG